MPTWEGELSPVVKFEASPAESFLSTPGEMYPSLFHTPTATTPTTLNPNSIMTPPSFTTGSRSDDAVFSALAGMTSCVSTPQPDDDDERSPSPDADASPATEKKTVKKRKSWGQVLPEPKTNLPPRKRAKTEDEKEQRRVERVLRNRRAAQSSRERKRQEVDALEKRNKELEARVLSVEKTNLLLLEELSKYRRTSGVVTRSSVSLDTLPSSNVTLSPELFSSQDGHMSQMMFSDPSNTVNPSSLSPEATPSPAPEQAAATGPDSAAPSSTPHGPSTDLTQRPAAMLFDLPCQQSVDLPRHWMASQTSPTLVSPVLLLLSALISTCQRPLTQIAMSLKAGFSLPPTPIILKTIILLVTRPRSSPRTPSTSPTSSTTMTATERPPPHTTLTASQRTSTLATTSPTLRITSLRKILTCSPTLARPLLDATMEALRLVSEASDDRVVESVTPDRMSNGVKPKPTVWMDGSQCPPKEVLLSLLWAIKVEERRLNGKVPVPIAGDSLITAQGCKRRASAQAPREKRQRLG